MKNINKNIVIAFVSFAAVIGLAMSFGTIKAFACDTNCTYPVPSGSCVASVSRAETGETITWRVNPTGGNGYYSYSWSGTDNLSGYTPNLTKSYSSEGTKTATVAITSYNQTVTRTCTVVIVDEDDRDDNDDLSGSCKGRPSDIEEGERVTWTATADGGDGDYEYDWSGTDNLEGDDRVITKRYNDEGRKTARVRITSDGESITRTCTIDVDDEDKDDNDDLRASCKASPLTGVVGERIKWTVNARGGDGDYEYDWDGTDNLRGDDNDEYVYKTYNTTGRKEAEIRVESDGDRVTVRCDVDIVGQNVYVPPQTPGGIYLNSIPATGISPNMKTALFVGGIFSWSAFMAYLFIARRNEKLKEKAMLASIEN